MPGTTRSGTQITGRNGRLGSKAVSAKAPQSAKSGHLLCANVEF
jgi:hypothetical protein